MAKRLGIITERFAQPLFHGLVSQRGSPRAPFELIAGAPAKLALKLREAQLDGAFLSPIDYAREYSSYRILPRVAVVSKGETGTVRLALPENSRSIKSLAVNIESSSSDVILAHLILKEEFEVMPRVIPFAAPVDPWSLHPDAVLISGSAPTAIPSRMFTLDLVDEWYNLTVFPYVHGFWVTREDGLTQDECRNLVARTETGLTELNILTDQKEIPHGEFSYSLSEEAIKSCTELFRMAYYHGMLEDIPEIHFAF
jgi:predicted solute-binding protein